MSPLPPTKHGEFFFGKKLCMGEQTFCGKFMGGIFYMGIIDQIMQGQGGRVTGEEVSMVESSYFSSH